MASYSTNTWNFLATDSLQLSPQFNGEDYLEWLDDEYTNSPVAIAMHLPDFANDKAQANAYIATLIKEISLVSAPLKPRRKACSYNIVTQGIPCFSLESLKLLRHKLISTFDMKDCITTVLYQSQEALNKEQRNGLIELGVNHVDILLDPLIPGIYAHDKEHFQYTQYIFDQLREKSHNAISLGVLCELETCRSPNATKRLNQYLELGVDRVCLLNNCSDLTKQNKWATQQRHELDDEICTLDCISSAILYAGYESIGANFFTLPSDPIASDARNGTLKSNYSFDKIGQIKPPHLGLGVGAFTQLPQGYLRNSVEIDDYVKRIDSGHLATNAGIHQHKNDQICQALIEKLNCDLCFTTKWVENRFGKQADALLRTADLQIAGPLAPYFNRSGDCYHLTLSGKYYARQIVTLIQNTIQNTIQNNQSAQCPTKRYA